MDWRKIYDKKLCSADEAVKLIKSGDRVVLGHAAGEPMALVDAMVANHKAYRNVTVSTMVSLGKGEYSLPEYKDNFRYESWFASAATRKSLEQGHGEFVPVYFHEIPINIRRNIFPVDVALVTVSKPDAHGYCSLGVSIDYTYQAVKSAKIVIAQVNEEMPYIYGDTFVHVDEIDALVEINEPLPQLQPPKIGSVEEAIGKNCASLIEDGSTLQLGIGAIPDAVLAQLSDKKHLGIHSEMISDGVVDLFEKGAIDCSKKSIDKGKMMVTFLMGTKKLYDFAHKNPMLYMKPVDYVNHPAVVAESSGMVSINACIQVDFMGQVVSDSIGVKQFSGVGGQVDFVRGAAMSKDGLGKAIIAMPSSTRAKDGRFISKIVPFIEHGAAVTTSRCDVDYIVTEYGIARMKGVTLKERAAALIKIAHPEAIEELKKSFKARFGIAFKDVNLQP